MNKLSLAVALALLLCLAALAQSQSEQPDSTVDPQVRLQVIENALRNLDDYYVFPEVAKQMEAAIRARLTNKEYDRITSAKELAASLTAHLQDISLERASDPKRKAQIKSAIEAMKEPDDLKKSN